MKTLKYFAMVLFVVAFTGSVVAQGFGRGQGRNMKKGEKYCITKDLNLNDSQTKKIEELRSAHQSKVIDLKATIEKTRLEKRDLISSDNFDIDKFKSIEEKMMKNRNAIQTERINHQTEVLKVLDKEQQKKWLTSKAKFNKKEGRRNSRKCW